jgi:hypothetical protein
MRGVFVRWIAISWRNVCVAQLAVGVTTVPAHQAAKKKKKKKKTVCRGVGDPSSRQGLNSHESRLAEAYLAVWG